MIIKAKFDETANHIINKAENKHKRNTGVSMTG